MIVAAAKRVYFTLVVAPRVMCFLWLRVTQTLRVS
jgi:hypothetical protein